MPTTYGLRDVRYGEVILVRCEHGLFEAEVWSTLGMNDCPQAEWASLDVDAIAKERGALAVVLNGPRYWALDFIESDIREHAEETNFGPLGMFRAALIDFGNKPPDPAPYTERSVLRETVFGFAKGSEIYELVTPGGTAYILQAYSQIVDRTLTAHDLPSLGARIDQPDGWDYRVRTLTEDLGVLSTNGVATVIQDELQNTYQRIERG